MEPIVHWLEETRRTVLADVKRWRRLVEKRATKLQGALRLPELERLVLVRVDGSLRALDGRVRARLAKVSKKRAPKPRAKKTPKPRASTTALAA